MSGPISFISGVKNFLSNVIDNGNPFKNNLSLDDRIKRIHTEINLFGAAGGFSKLANPAKWLACDPKEACQQLPISCQIEDGDDTLIHAVELHYLVKNIDIEKCPPKVRIAYSMMMTYLNALRAYQIWFCKGVIDQGQELYGLNLDKKTPIRVGDTLIHLTNVVIHSYKIVKAWIELNKKQSQGAKTA